MLLIYENVILIYEDGSWKKEIFVMVFVYIIFYFRVIKTAREETACCYL